MPCVGGAANSSLLGRRHEVFDQPRGLDDEGEDASLPLYLHQPRLVKARRATGGLVLRPLGNQPRLVDEEREDAGVRVLPLLQPEVLLLLLGPVLISL